MLTASPGHGRITRVTLADRGDPATPGGRVVPHPAALLDEFTPDDRMVRVVDHVDVVLSHRRDPYATGLVLTLKDADAAYLLSEAALAAAQLLARRVRADELDEQPRPEQVHVEGLARRCERCHRVTSPGHPEGLQGDEQVHKDCLAAAAETVSL